MPAFPARWYAWPFGRQSDCLTDFSAHTFRVSGCVGGWARDSDPRVRMLSCFLFLAAEVTRQLWMPLPHDLCSPVQRNGEPTTQTSEGEARGERPQPPAQSRTPTRAHATGTPIGKEPRREAHPTRRRTRRPPQRGSHRHTQQHTQHTKPETSKPRRLQRQRPQTSRATAAAKRRRSHQRPHPEHTRGRWVGGG